MALLTLLEQRDAARIRYAAAVKTYRSAVATLGALDRKIGDGAPGFGHIVNVAELRHGTANPEESGSLQDDIAAAFAAPNEV